MVKVLVAIPTYLRPSALERGLRAVLAHLDGVTGTPSSGVVAEVLVVDNDPAASARDTVLKYSDRGVRYAHEPVPGISAARNRALSEAGDADLIAFIDDDEEPREEWLLPLLNVWRETGAAAVMGRVVSVFEGEIDPWLRAGRFFVRRSMASGTDIEVAAAGNLLLDTAQVRASGVRFDDRLGLSGGEDTLFSTQLRAAGHRIVWCEESETTDYVPADRTTRRWALRRSWSHGNSGSVVAVMTARGPLDRLARRGSSAAFGAARLLSGAARWLVGLITRDLTHQARGARTAFRGMGMLAGAFGSVFHEYGRA